MLTLLIALSVASEPPRVVTLPRRQVRVATVRKRAPRKPAARALPQPAQLCVTGSCAPAIETSYRLTGSSAVGWSPKMDVVRSTGVPCGLQGAPVCPKKGRRFLQASID
ncbi:hypothetical protein [Sphingomonas sp.]|uniref:hypothetical protein n=1 Tax=Sphingomonas sp. TaxID=28214 RepID=UPI0031CDE31D